MNSQLIVSLFAQLLFFVGLTGGGIYLKDRIVIANKDGYEKTKIWKIITTLTFGAGAAAIISVIAIITVLVTSNKIPPPKPIPTPAVKLVLPPKPVTPPPQLITTTQKMVDVDLFKYCIDKVGNNNGVSADKINACKEAATVTVTTTS